MTTQTLTGAIKAALATPLPALAVYRDVAPPAAAGDTVGPWLVVQEGISVTPYPLGDATDPTADLAVEEEVQIDLYQTHHNAAGTITADPTLAGQVLAALERMILTQAPGHVYRFRVLNASRLPDPDTNIERVTYRCRVSRNLP